MSDVKSIKMIFVILLFILLIAVVLSLYFRSQRKKSVAFFHPNCLDCAGGERVLWGIIDSLKNEDLDLVIYSENCNYEQAKEKIYSRFDLCIPSKLRFVNVGSAYFLKKFPRFTLLLQAVSSIAYVFQCLFKEVPSVVIDTTGAPFASFVWKLFGGCTVIYYIHYPFISTDMLESIKENKSSFNNDEKISKSNVLTRIKIIYYKLLCWFYKLTGRFMDTIMVNSTWTSNHIETLYGRKPTILYPPCDCRQFSEFPLDNHKKGVILSVGQFRPEKKYELQLEIMEKLAKENKNVKLIIAGGCRNQADNDLFDGLQKKIKKNDLPVELRKNVSYEELKNLLSTADIGLHTMYNEHFGICVVEYMASGLIPVSNRSAGPLMDIVKDEKYLALTCDEYVQKIQNALNDNEEKRDFFRKQSQIFSLENFEENFMKINIQTIKEALK